MQASKHILCVAEDPAVRRTKHMVLEQLGFNVVSMGSLEEVEATAAARPLDLAIIGRTFNTTTKRAIAEVIRRRFSHTPILEMCNVSPEIAGADHVLRSPNPEDLAEMVKAILNVKA